jgi:hypothetical protein
MKRSIRDLFEELALLLITIVVGCILILIGVWGTLALFYTKGW